MADFDLALGGFGRLWMNVLYIVFTLGFLCLHLTLFRPPVPSARIYEEQKTDKLSQLLGESIYIYLIFFYLLNWKTVAGLKTILER